MVHLRYPRRKCVAFGRTAALMVGVTVALAAGAWVRPSGGRLLAADQPAVTDDDPLPGQPGAGDKPVEPAKALIKGMVIGCLGDEWTLPNPAEKMKPNCYPAALDLLINAKYGKGFVQVVSAGQKAATITEYEKLYESGLAKAKPDLVIIQDSDQPNNSTGFKMDLVKLVDLIQKTPGTHGQTPKVLLLETYHEPELPPQEMYKMREFMAAHDWLADNREMQLFAGTGKATFVELRVTLGTGMGALRSLNYTRPFKLDGLVPTYIGSTLIAMRVLQVLGENLDSYNYSAYQFPETVQKAMIGLARERQFVNGVPVEPAGGAAASPAGKPAGGPAAGGSAGAELKNFDNALRLSHSAPVVYFGSDMMFKNAWVAQNIAFLKRVYGEKVTTYNAGKAGDTSTTALTRLKADVLDHKPALVLIEFAFEDARDAAKVSVDDSRKNLTSMVQTIRKTVPDCDVVLVTTQALNTFGAGDARRSDLESYYKVVREVAKAEQTGLIDNAEDFTRWITSDKPRYASLMGENLMLNFDGQVVFERKAEDFFKQALPPGQP